MWASRIERLGWSLLSEYVGASPCALRVEWWVDGRRYSAIQDGIGDDLAADDRALGSIARSMSVRTMIDLTRASTPCGHDQQRMGAPS